MTAAQALERPHDWTLADLAELPDTGWRYEIVDGSLLVSPPPEIPHVVAADSLVDRLKAVAPREVRVLPGMAGIVTRRSVYVPDAVVVTAEAARRARKAFTPEDVLLVVEVLSPSNRTTDLVTKRADYAAAGIPAYWIVDLDGPTLTALQLVGDTYKEIAQVRAGQRWRARHPFPVEIDPARLRIED